MNINWKEDGMEINRTWEYEERRLIYIAGPLSGDACQYITNLNNMLEMSEIVKKFGVSVCVPGNDFLNGLINGKMDIFDYLQGSMDLMIKCDGVYLCEGWEDSKGCLNEIAEANKRGIPVFDNLRDLGDWTNGDSKVKVKPVGNVNGTIHVEKQMSDVKK